MGRRAPLVRVFQVSLVCGSGAQVNFLNLTNGIQALEDYGPDVLRPYSFMRLQSTWCEQKLWADVLMGLPDEFLLRAALGEELTVYDYGAGKDVPRAVWQGLEWVSLVLCQRWYDREYVPVGRAAPMWRYWVDVAATLDARVKARVDYFGRFAAGVLDIRARTGRSRYDGRYSDLADILRRHHDHAIPVPAG